ncbi:DUF982 domain-containing protein [Labrys sp. La1]|uniref:DUF982 domain-containing protein n=1 Tax=Labrys sp. La1 TaxID=3404917 RepID=UPI003EB7A5A5
MDSDHFGKPVRFLLDAGHWIEIRDVIEALAFLRTRWPDEGGDLYEHALDVCQKAISDLKSVEAARFEFVDALSDAGFLIVRDFEHPLMAATSLARRVAILRPGAHQPDSMLSRLKSAISRAVSSMLAAPMNVSAKCALPGLTGK